jgi:hypothetical protein
MNPKTFLSFLSSLDWDTLSFRTVWKVTPKSKVKFQLQTDVDSFILFDSERDLDNHLRKNRFDASSKKRLTCRVCDDFTFETKIYKGTTFYGDNKNYGYIDLIDTLSFSVVMSRNNLIPRTGDFDESDMVCGQVDEEGRFKWWFICSQQFFRMWTCLFRPENESSLVEPNKRKRIETEGLKKFIFKHNILMTNSSFRKEHLRCHSYNLPVDGLKDKLHLIRFEPSFKKYVHVYCALVMFGKFGINFEDEEVPDSKTELAQKYPLKKWDLPEGYKDRLKDRMREFVARKRGFKDLKEDWEKIMEDSRVTRVVTPETQRFSLLCMDLCSMNKAAEAYFFSVPSNFVESYDRARGIIVASNVC